MDADELLSSFRLPEVAVDTDVALQRTTRQGRTRRRRRVAVAGAVSGLLIVGLLAASLTLLDRRNDETVSAGPPPGAGVPRGPEPGDPAVWAIDPAAPPSSTDSALTASVTRLGCHGGSTGKVLRPGVTTTDTEVVLTFTVEAAGPGATFTCQGNEAVPYEIDLGGPIGGRVLVDGSCVFDGLAASTSFCEPDGVRWRAGASTDPGDGVPAENIVRDFLRFAGDPSADAVDRLPLAEEVHLGLGSELQQTRSRTQLADPAAWVIDEAQFRAYSGPFSALDVAAGATSTVVTVGEHPHCASPPVPPPDAVAHLTRVSVQPDIGNDSCLRWWTVDLYVNETGQIEAVTVDLWEP
ncbi:MAG: hypothetical protein ABIP36_04555 [Acidimicrobiales bacterium]